MGGGGGFRQTPVIQIKASALNWKKKKGGPHLLGDGEDEEEGRGRERDGERRRGGGLGIGLNPNSCC